jgi:DNA-binding FrmR family transcriptional regulator
VAFEEGRACIDLAQQLHAVEKAIGEAKKTLIHDHIDHCLEQTVGPMPRDARGPLEEFKEITKYL